MIKYILILATLILLVFIGLFCIYWFELDCAMIEAMEKKMKS